MRYARGRGERKREIGTETQIHRKKERDRDKQRWERGVSLELWGLSQSLHGCIIAPQCAVVAHGRFLAHQCAFVAQDRTASIGGISGLGMADPASDSDLPPDVGADAELLVAEGSASFSGMSWHGMADPGSLDVDLTPDTDV